MAQTRIDSVMPELPVRNLSAAVEFYTGVLGFRLEHLHGDEYAVMRRDTARIGLMRGTPEWPPGIGRVYVFVNTGIEEMFKTVSTAAAVMGGRVVETLDDRPYGLKDFALTDPDGNRLGFGAYL